MYIPVRLINNNMKKFTIILITILWGTATCLLAQDFSIQEEKMPTDDIMVDAWVIKLGEDLKFAQNTFKDYAKEKLDVKVKSSGKQMLLAEEVSASTISDKRGDLKVYFSPEGDSLTAGIAFVHGYDIFVNSADDPEAMSRLKDFTKGFQRYYYNAYYEQEIEQNEKLLSSTNKELNKSEKKINRLTNNVKKNNKKLDEEGDAGKRSKYHDKNAESEAEINKLTDKLPELRGDIQKFESNIARARTEITHLDSKINVSEKMAENE